MSSSVSISSLKSSNASQSAKISSKMPIYAIHKHTHTSHKSQRSISFGLILFCGLQQDIFLSFDFHPFFNYIHIVTQNIQSHQVMCSDGIRSNPFSRVCGENKFLCFMISCFRMKLNILMLYESFFPSHDDTLDLIQYPFTWL